MFELELKFRVADEAAFRSTITEMAKSSLPAETQTDVYFNHPARDFAITDEALRLRTIGKNTELTYKGPSAGSLAKGREELEVAIGCADDFAVILNHLGFRHTRRVRKHREAWSLLWERDWVLVCLDRVEELGLFCELEVLLEEEDYDGRAEQSLWSLAGRLGLSDPIRKSYLEMLLEK
jgi:adenylate cyclase class 2